VCQVGSGPLGRGGVQKGSVAALDEMVGEAWMMAQSRHLSMNGRAEGTAWSFSRRLLAGTPTASSGKSRKTFLLENPTGASHAEGYICHREHRIKGAVCMKNICSSVFLEA